MALEFPRRLVGAPGIPLRAQDFLDGTYRLHWADNIPNWDQVLSPPPTIANLNIPPIGYNLPTSYPSTGMPLVSPKIVIFHLHAESGPQVDDFISQITTIYNSLAPGMTDAGLYHGIHMQGQNNTADSAMNDMLDIVFSTPVPTLVGHTLVFMPCLMNVKIGASTLDIFGGPNDTTSIRGQFRDYSNRSVHMRNIVYLVNGGIIPPFSGTIPDYVADAQQILDYLIDTDDLASYGLEDGGLMDDSINAGFFQAIIESHFGVTL